MHAHPLCTFDGRAAFITGSGHGISKATAVRMAGQGAIVGINDLKAEFVDEAVAAVHAVGGRAVPIVRDVATREGMREALSEFTRQVGRLDVLVNNAAWVRYQPVLEITPEVVDRMLAIGFKSVLWGIQAAAELMDAERGGAIVNVASVAGFASAPRSMVYSGIKAGILGITRAAAADLGGRGIRVNAVSPGAVPTEGTIKHRNLELDHKRIARTPLGRLGRVDDIADVICFLASDAARFVTAEAIVVDGGSFHTLL